LMTQRGLIREIVSIIASIADLQIARSFAQSLYVLRGDDSDPATADVIEAAPAEIRDAFIEMTSDPVLWSYLDVIEASKPPAEVFDDLVRDRDPVVAALAISAVAGTHRALAEAPAAELMERIKTPSALIEEALAAVVQGRRSETIAKMAELLASEVFVSVNLDTLAQIARQSKRVTFSAGEQICRFGESSDSFFVLVRGETEAYVEGENGRTVFRRLQSGAVLGELGVLTGRPRTASIEVVSAIAEVIEVPREVIDNLLNRDLHATRAVLSVVSSYLLGPAPVPTEPSRSIEAMA